MGKKFESPELVFWEIKQNQRHEFEMAGMIG